MDKKYIIMDVDTGVDDSMAIMLAAGSPDIEVLAITTTAGNCSVDDTTKNTLKVCEMLGLDVPVAKGAWRPLIDPPFDYSIAPMVDIHGRDGLGNVGNMLPEPSTKRSELCAADLMAQAVKNAPDKVTIVATGPMGNVATFLVAYPQLHDKIDCIALMGGAAYGGNLGFSVEANIGHDPDAAAIVFMSDIKKVMFGLDATMQVFITDDERDVLEANGGNAGAFLKACLKQYSDIYKMLGGLPGAVLHDSMPVAWLLDESVATMVPAYVEVELNGKNTRGRTVVDFQGMCGKPFNTLVAMAADREKVIAMHLEAAKKFA